MHFSAPAKEPETLEGLFSAFRIKNCILKNRIVMPSLASFLIESGGTVAKEAVEHYRRRAAGGPAMIMMEACAVSPEGVVSPYQARIDHDRFIEGLAEISAVLKSEGAVPAIQIHHSGRQTSAKVIKQKPLAPSALPCASIRGDVQPLTIDGIQELVQKFADAAARAREAGFEFIELHGAHGYLINQFLSCFSNVRNDCYGGDVAGRTRFAGEIVQAMRARLGPDFPISFKISAEEFVPRGLNVSESIDILKILTDAGIDVVQVSAGNDATPEWICQPMFMKKACLAEVAATIKKGLTIPVMAVGRINDPQIANEIIAHQRADLVCMGRGLLADPEMPNKARSGRFDEIRTCIACNSCMESIFRKGRIECLVNPALGRETEMTIRPAVKRKKIMIIGGGPGGLNAAWVAAQRGHEVHLYEKKNLLGGQLVLGSTPRYKKDLMKLVYFLTAQGNKFKVHYHLGHEASLETVKKETPDAVILAIGSLPFLPPVDGIKEEIVVPVNTILNGGRPVVAETVVVGGGPTGCELALHLAEQNCPVTLVEMLPKIGKGLESVTRRVLIKKLAENHVAVLTGCKLEKVTARGIYICDGGGGERFIEARRVVITTGSRPDNDLYEQIVALGLEAHKIGDCLEPRSAKEAIFEGAVLGRSV